MKQGKESDRGLRIASGTGEEIRANVADNTLKAYEHATRKLEAWLEGRAPYRCCVGGIYQVSACTGEVAGYNQSGRFRGEVDG